MDAVTLAAANATAAKKYAPQRAQARTVAANMTSGAITSMSETKQAVTTFGTAPLVVSGGKIVHTPAASGVSAGYMQAQLTGTVGTVAAVVAFPAGSNANHTIVLPAAAWNTGTLGPAGVHFVVYGSGSWHVSYWDGSAEQVYKSGNLIAPVNDGLPRFLAVSVDTATSSVGLVLPDGTTAHVTDTRIAPNVSAYVVWEHWWSNGATEVPIQTIECWAHPQVTKASNNGASLGDLARALPDPARYALAPTFTKLADGADISLTTSTVEIMRTTATVPPSKKFLVKLYGAVQLFSPADATWLVRPATVAGAADITRGGSEYVGRNTITAGQAILVTGAPTGGTYTLSVTFNGTTQTTAAIAYNATASAVQTALRALSNATTALVVSGQSGSYWVTFDLGNTDGNGFVPKLSAAASLTGGTTPGVTVFNAGVDGPDRSTISVRGQIAIIVTCDDANVGDQRDLIWQARSGYNGKAIMRADAASARSLSMEVQPLAS